jgi:hypothetical protein
VKVPRACSRPTVSGGETSPFASTTRTSMPPIACPSVPKIFSAGSPGRAMVTPPFSVMPQHDSTSMPSRSVAFWTITLGIGAPAQTNVRRVFTLSRVTASLFARSERNGVEAMVKVAPSAWMRRAASGADQMSSSTSFVLSRIGIIMP